MYNFDYTMQRSMVLEFPSDSRVYQINDQFMFGHSILVAPIYTEVQSRDVYLPGDANDYFNFFSGKKFQSGTTIKINELPLNEMIVFFGPSLFFHWGLI